MFLLDPHGREAEMQAAGRDTAQRLGQLFAPGVTKPLALAGTLGAIIQIARNWIVSGFAAPVSEVVETALTFSKASKNSA